ncbi:hypothetical protein Celaphus_00013738 [Cervus elaphus hippelaphus]|uniref:Septin-type G domain-containing protein n=1 Tax=Cervus elaphus hippelaphus TaxID=46360 RepID=A0A212CDU6_CEREH|nr:hypothetical protein Celaphus_00013738 [Cervus elaphus hippelaphus]
MAMDLAALDKRPGTASRLSTRATNRPGLTVNLATPNPSRLDTGIESPDLDTNLGSAMDVAAAGTTKPGGGMDSVTPDPDKVGKAIATAGTAKPETTTAGAAMERAAPDPVRLGTVRPDTVMLVNTAKLGVTTNSPALDTSRLVIAMGPAVPVTPDPAAGETTLDSVINLTPDVATHPSMLSQSTDTALGHPTADAATDWATELDRARETKGQSGLGKSTLVNTLFKSQVSRKASSWNREEKIPKTVEIKAIGHVIEEGGVKMKLTVIDTPGFGDQINNENCWEPIEKYINEQYEKFLKEEVNIARKKRIPDTRVHCCLYFISPTGHSYVSVLPPSLGLPLVCII